MILTVPVFVGQIDRGEPLVRKGAFGAQLAPAENGLSIVRVIPWLTAEKLGLKAGDVVTSVNGTKVDSTAKLSAIVSSTKSGSPFSVEAIREGKPLSVKTDLVERPKQKEDGFKVRYDQVISRGKRIRVIATYPADGKPHPTVFLIGGIGAYSTDGEFATIPYGNIMGPIAKAGYTTIRMEKPGQGDSEGPSYTDLRFGDEFDAYLQTLRLAKTFEFVDKTKIAIFGHSMGGAFGPMVAEKEPVAGLAVSATMSKTWVEYWIENNRRQTRLAGANPTDTDVQTSQVAAMAHYLFYVGMSPDELMRARPELTGIMKATSPDGKTMSGVGIPFFQELAKQNLASLWEKLDTKVLALWGECDFIATRFDQEYIAEIVNGKRPGTAEFKPLPNSDHGFMQTKDFADSAAKWGKGGAFNPSIVTTLLDWLKKTIG